MNISIKIKYQIDGKEFTTHVPSSQENTKVLNVLENIQESQLAIISAYPKVRPYLFGQMWVVDVQQLENAIALDLQENQIDLQGMTVQDFATQIINSHLIFEIIYTITIGQSKLTLFFIHTKHEDTLKDLAIAGSSKPFNISTAILDGLSPIEVYETLNGYFGQTKN